MHLSKNIKSKHLKPNKKPFYKKPWIYIIGTPLIVLTAGVTFAWHSYGPLIQSSIRTGYVKSNDVTQKSLSETSPTIIYAENGSVMQKLNTASELVVTKKDVNPYISKGFVSVEDKRFYKNKGVDVYGTIRSIILSALGHPLQGGSTITQQLARNKILHSQEQTISRKISEMVVAQELTKKFKKQDILIGYLNSSYFGHGAYGVDAASNYYFGKDQSKLSVRESAMIIGLTNNPTLYDPTTNPKISDKKISETLYTMYINGVINKKQYKQAKNEKTQLHITPLKNDKDFTKNYAVSFAVQKAAQDMAVQDGFQLKYLFKTDDEYNKYHEQYNIAIQNEIDKITGGGYNIYTSIDPELQQKVQDAAINALGGYQERDSNGKLMPQVASTVIDNQTHNVVAVVGGRGTDNDYFNRAYQSYRQPGSTAKPIVAYTTAFEKGDTPQSNVNDSPLAEFPGVHNFSGSYSGNMTIRNAVVNSLNLPALKEAMKTPISDIVSKLGQMHFSHISPEDSNYIIAIGGFTHGVSTTEMAGAYSAIANEGQFYDPSNVTKIQSSDSGLTLYENDHQSSQVYSPSAAYMMTDVMKSVGSGPTVFAPALADNYPHNLQAVKTGQTDGDKDVYFAENTYYYSSATWVGNDNGQLLTDAQSSLAMTANKAIQTVLLSGKTPKDFNKPNNVSKNGDTIIKTGKDSITNNAQATLNDLNAQFEANSTKENNARLNSQDYRIMFGLSSTEEKSRENKVQNIIDQIKAFNFTKSSQYADLQEALTKAKTLSIKVKHLDQQDAFNNEINDLQNNISSEYTQLLSYENSVKSANQQEKINEASETVKANNQSQINTLKDKLASDKAELNNVFSTNNSSKQNDAIKSLQSDIDQLNKLGEPTNGYKIITDGSSGIILIPLNTPTLSFSN